METLLHDIDRIRAASQSIDIDKLETDLATLSDNIRNLTANIQSSIDKMKDF